MENQKPHETAGVCSQWSVVSMHHCYIRQNFTVANLFSESIYPFFIEICLFNVSIFYYPYDTGSFRLIRIEIHLQK